MKYVIRVRLFWIVAILLLAACTESIPQTNQTLSGIVYRTRSGLQIFRQGERTELISAIHLGTYDTDIILSPDGRYVAYSQSGQDLWLVDVNTMESTVLINKPIRDEDASIRYMAWSPDGQQIGMLVSSIGPTAIPEKSTLFLFHIQSRKLFEVLSGVIEFTWIPKTNGIAFVKQFGEGPTGLYVMYGGVEPQVLVEGYMQPYVAASPLGDFLSVILPTPNNKTRDSLFMIDLADHSVHDLLQSSDRDEAPYPRSPAWSPDGSQVAFLACVPLENASTCASSLMVVDVETKQVRALASGIQSPIAWSPDGNTIVGIEQGGNHGIIQVSLVDGSVSTIINDRPANCPFEYR